MWTAPLNVVRFDATTLWHFDAGSGRRPPHQKRHIAPQKKTRLFQSPRRHAANHRPKFQSPGCTVPRANVVVEV
jgi:hypothetical protein